MVCFFFSDRRDVDHWWGSFPPCWPGLLHNHLHQVANLLEGFSWGVVSPGWVPVSSLHCSTAPRCCQPPHRSCSQSSSRTLRIPEIPPCSDVHHEQFSEVPGSPEYFRFNESETAGADGKVVSSPSWRWKASCFFFLGLFMDRLPTNIRSLIFDELLSEKMSYGQYEKELTLCNLSLLRIVGYFSCISQVHQHPPLPPPQEQTEFLQIPHGHWSFCVSFPLPALLSFSSRFWDPVENCQCFPQFGSRRFLCQSSTPQPWNLSSLFNLAHPIAAQISMQLFSIPLSSVISCPSTLM